VLPASSVRARILLERGRVGRGAHLEVRSAVTSAGAGLVAGALLAGTLNTVGMLEAVVPGALLGVAATAVWSTMTAGPVARQLRRQVRRERRVTASLAPLESAGWVVLHDRLVAAHRVPHVLVGPVGVVLGL